ncbi:hypothetical protein TNCV_3775851 [Trichonephila clavipes]|nr:hypothetical protein TNCV_3775851 [Trichonephila clavipes]
MDQNQLDPGKGLVFPQINIDETAAHPRFLLISLPKNDMSHKSLFAIHKALIRIGKPYLTRLPGHKLRSSSAKGARASSTPEMSISQHTGYTD